MTDNVEPGAIDGAPLSPTSPPAPTGKDPFSDPDLPVKMGVIGGLIGHGEEKKGNIAFVALILAFLLLVACIVGILCIEDEGDSEFLTILITPIFGVVTGIIGYITGNRD